MELLASRVERDQDDIRLLYRLCGFESAEQGIEWVAPANPAYVIPARTKFMLEKMFPEKQLDPSRASRPRPPLTCPDDESG